MVQPIGCLLDRRCANATRAAPMHVRIDQAGYQESAAQVLDLGTLRRRRPLIFERYLGDFVIANRDARVDDASAETVEDGSATEHEDLAAGVTGLDATRARHVGHLERRC